MLANPELTDGVRTEPLLRDARLTLEAEADTPIDMVESLDPDPDM